MTLAAFRVRSFRFQWPADLLTSLAFEMETVILGWYVLVQTGSVLLLTAFGSLLFLGTLLAPMYGVLGDRLGGRAMLTAMRAVYAVLAALLTILSLTGSLTPVWVFAIATLVGLVRPNDLVLRNSLIGETIPSQHLMGAVGLSRATMDSARVAGALAGAGLSTVLGIGPAYLLITTLYLTSGALTFGVARRHPVPDPGEAPRAVSPGVTTVAMSSPSSGRDLKDGLLHVLRTPALLAPMWLAFLINLTAYPVSNGLLPYVAKNIYLVDARGLGWLVAGFAFGGLLGSIATVATGGPRRPERSMLVCTAIWYAVLLGFGHAGSLGAGLIALVLAGFVQNVAMISMTASLLAAAGNRFRARVMGVRTLAVYGLPLGLMAAGALIDLIGFPLTISALSVVGLVFTLLIAIRWRQSLWRLTSL
ncbi:MAG: MFS transporter [Candidatus Rokubacteria bacterium]|nr:MFS transporter [Candidatus Rokubacteria bacterium]